MLSFQAYSSSLSAHLLLFTHLILQCREVSWGLISRQEKGEHVLLQPEWTMDHESIKQGL